MADIDKSRQIAGIGELVLDIVIRDGQPQAAVPGGSVFNSMVSLGRTLGRDNPAIKLRMVSQTGDDAVADMMSQFMLDNGLSADCIARVKGQSTLSMAMLDSAGNARYEFFRDRSQPPFEAPQVRFSRGDVALFGSIFAVDPLTAPQVKGFVRRAASDGAIVYYDVNFRPNHPAQAATFEENMAMSDIVRASAEDIAYLYGSDDAERVYREHIAPYCRNFICTRGGDPAELFSPGVHAFCETAPVSRIRSTIGAGDNFNAGVIWALVHGGFTKERLQGLSAGDWHSLAAPAMQFSAAVCGSLFNYVDKDFTVKI